MTFKDTLQKIQDAHPGWTFAQCWAQLKKINPELFSPSLRPATAPDNVPNTPLSHHVGEPSPDPRARPFKNYDERSDDPRIVKSEALKAMTAKIQAIQASNPRISFKEAWERLKRDSMLMAHTALIEAKLVTSL